MERQKIVESKEGIKYCDLIYHQIDVPVNLLPSCNFHNDLTTKGVALTTYSVRFIGRYDLLLPDCRISFEKQKAVLSLSSYKITQSNTRMHKAVYQLIVPFPFWNIFTTLFNYQEGLRT